VGGDLVTYRVNLLPADLIPGRGFDKRYLLRLAGIGAAGSLVAIYLAFLGSYHLTCNQIVRYEQELRAVQPRAEKVEEFIEDRRSAEETTAALQQILESRQTWADLLDSLAYHLPVDTWLTRVALYNAEAEEKGKHTGQNKQHEQQEKEANPPPSPDTMLIEGASLSVSSIGVTVRNLASLGYFRSVCLEEFHRAEDGSLVFCIRAELERTNR